MKRISLSIVLIALSLSLAACGGGSSASSNLNVTMTEFSFTPADYTVKAGQQVNLHLTNNGAVTHSFAILKKDANIGSDFTADDEQFVYWRANVDAGASSTETFTAPSDPGDYQVICAEPGHYTAGMVAKLHVVSP